jgi:hypothetical protein
MADELNNLDPKFIKAYTDSALKAGKAVEQIKKELIEINKIQKESNTLLSDYSSKGYDILNNLRKRAKIQSDIKNDTKAYFEYLKEVKEIDKDIANIESEILKLKLKGLAEDSEEISYLKKKTKELRDQRNLIAEQLQQANKYKAFLSQANSDLGKIKKSWLSIKNTLQLNDVFKWEKSIKTTAMNMGLTGSRAQALSKNIQAAAWQTADFGVGIEDIATIQGTYSDELGRAIDLGAKAGARLGAMSKATGLGAEGAAKFAAEMDVVGMNAGRTADYVEQTMNDSRAMGLNTTKVVKVLSQNLKMLNKYNFKGGAKSLASMAQSTTKMGVGMDMAAPFAEKLFDIEGAVETSAQLQVMGGEWAKLADPFKLMYQARNDMEGLTTSLMNATKGMAFFNKTSGEIEVTALDMDKLRKISQMTGVDMDKLVTSAKNMKKYGMIDMQIGAKFKDEKVKKFIEAQSTIDDKGVAHIMLDGKDTLLSALKGSDELILKKTIDENKKMEQTAKDSRSLDELWSNTVMKLKQALLPIVESITKKLAPALDNLMKKFNDPKFIDSIIEFGRKIGDFIGGIGAFILKFPLLSAGLFGLFEVGKWFLSGMALRSGFNAGGGVPGLPGGGATGAGAGAGAFGTTAGAGVGANFNAALGSKILKLGGVVAGLTTAYTSYQDNKAKGMGTGENLGRSGLKGTGAGLGAWGGAAAGAAIGSVVPIVGTIIGGLIGGALGAWGGGALGEGAGDAIYGKNTITANDGVVFNPKDKFMKVNDGMMVAGTNVNGNKQLAQTLASMAPTFGNKSGLMPGTSNVSSSSSAPAVINHNFNDLKINGTIMLTTANGLSADLSKDLLQNPSFVRSISKMVHVETDKNLKGGKTSG